jgi:hypothetical protein
MSWGTSSWDSDLGPRERHISTRTKSVNGIVVVFGCFFNFSALLIINNVSNGRKRNPMPFSHISFACGFCFIFDMVLAQLSQLLLLVPIPPCLQLWPLGLPPPPPGLPHPWRGYDRRAALHQCLPPVLTLPPPQC